MSALTDAEIGMQLEEMRRQYKNPDWPDGAQMMVVRVPVAKQRRIEFLETYRGVVKSHMLGRIEDNDQHGASDDANDIREIDAELRGLRF